MGYLRQRQEAKALVALREARLTGAPGGFAIPDALAHSLTSDRLASVDEFGALRITERGQQHLLNLERKGVLRPKSGRH